MLARVQSFLMMGLDDHPCEIEVDLNEVGMPKVTLVGLPDTAVKEAMERVHSAIFNSGYAYPDARLLVNLAPADLRKEGPMYDLPIAIGLLIANGTIARATKESAVDYRQYAMAGELALDGRLRPIHNAISLALHARKRGLKGIILPKDNAREAAAVHGINVFGMHTLASVVSFLNEQEPLEPEPEMNVAEQLDHACTAIDFRDVKGQEVAKRAMLIAAAGAHNILMLGPAGTGKSMLAKALPGIIPCMSHDEALEVTRIYSTCGLIGRGEGIKTTRPVRTPHHTASSPAIIGGGTIPRPGEVSLAHHGILFLDELPEFSRFVLETLRQPLEDRIVTISRAHSTLCFPADFMLVAALNPTPRGDLPTGPEGKRVMERYLSRLSGPLIDRIDIHVEVPAIPFEKLRARPDGATSAELRERVEAARDRQRQRQGAGLFNCALSGKQLDQFAKIDETSALLLGQAVRELGLSARAYDKIRRVARSIADLEGKEHVTVDQVSEAIQYRLLDRML